MPDAVRSAVYLAGGVPAGLFLALLLVPDPTGTLPLLVGVLAGIVITAGLARVDPLVDAA